LTGVPDRIIHIQIFNTTVKQRFSFVSRGLEFHHQLNLNSFDFHVDAEGDEYTTISHETQQKKIQGGIMCAEAPADKFLYGNAVDQNVCPVASLKMFISKNLQHRHENQKSSGLIDGETLDLVIQNVWLD
jgi:hypothetical protein